MQGNVTALDALLALNNGCEYRKVTQDTGRTEGRVQRYEEVPQKLEQAVQLWHNNMPKLEFVLSLGDIIDGRDSQVR